MSASSVGPAGAAGRRVVEVLDGHQLPSDVTRVLADEKVNILSASATTSGDRVAINGFTFEMGNPQHLGYLLIVVRNVAAVYDVYRVSSAACYALIR
jgi:GTP pyrophosphokinase